MCVQQNATDCNTRKRCRQQRVAVRVPPWMSGGCRNGPDDSLIGVKSRPKPLSPLYTSVQFRGPLPKPLSLNNLRRNLGLLRKPKCPKMSTNVRAGKRSFLHRSRSLERQTRGDDLRCPAWFGKGRVILNKLIDNGWRDQAAFDQDPDLDSIRNDRRYRALLGRVKP